MNCPVCGRNLAPTLSICPACGTMMNDSVREELQTKIVSGKIALRPQPRPAQPAEPQRIPPPPAAPAPAMTAEKVNEIVARHTTSRLVAPKTSPTLVGFQNKNAPLPDWRLQLQNAVQQRKNAASNPGEAARPTVAPVVERVEEPKTPAIQVEISDSRVANALRRIEQSRQSFQSPDAGKSAQAVRVARPMPPRPLEVVTPRNVAPAPAGWSGQRTAQAVAVAMAPQPSRTETTAVPVSIPPMRLDTNKLPKLEAVVSPEPVAFAVDDDPLTSPVTTGTIESKHIEIRAHRPTTDEFVEEPYSDEIEDLAPFSMRFGAGLFDLIITGFVSLVLLSPIAFSGREWFSLAGLLTCAGSLAMVTFLYMTIGVGFYGKTIGMRLFSLELVDAMENEYPTLKQAAVNSCIFLISLATAGVGFLTIFFNEERRALHDLLSGTILVREF
jgi:uncharacterized RDD family membrane protein YckC